MQRMRSIAAVTAIDLCTTALLHAPATKKIGTKVYVSYNTTDRLDKALSEVIAAYSGETYFAHGI